jgi:integrase
MNRRSAGEGNISQRANGTWTARIQLGIKEDGKPKVKAFYGKTKKEVADKLAEYRQFTKSGYKDEDIPEFQTYITNWLYNVKVNELKAMSFDRLESTIKNHIIPAVGHLKTNMLTDTIIQTQLINKKVKTYSHSSIKKIYDALNACFKYAVARRDLRFNPMATVSMPSKSKFETKEIEIFTEEELKILTNIADTRFSNGVLRYKNGWGVILMIYTGIRMGEALALKWEDYDEVGKKLLIRKNIGLVINRTGEGKKYKLLEQETLKTRNSDRVIPLSQMAVTALSELHKTSRNNIISTREGRPVRPRNFQNTFDYMLEHAGLAHKGLHATRHTFASLLFKRSADAKTVGELLGHADARTTYNTYIHIMQSQKQSAVALLDEI